MRDVTIINTTTYRYYRINVTATNGSYGLSFSEIEMMGDFVNTAPVANNIEVTTDEDVAVNITLTGTDIDGDYLTYSIQTQPTNGTAEILEANFTVYTPNADWFGVDSFTYKANDGELDSEIATVTITVNAVNDFPVVQSIANQEMACGDTLIIPVVATDVDGDMLVYSTFSSGDFLTANFEYFSSDLILISSTGINDVATVNVIVSDGYLYSMISFGVTLACPNFPIADDISIETDEDVFVEITLTGSDADGDDLTFTIVEEPTNGVAINEGGVVQYTPDTDWFGVDTFTYVANDGAVYSAPATVTITVNAVNDAPVAGTIADIDLFIAQIADVDIAVFTDVDGDTLTYSTVTSDSTIATVTRVNAVAIVTAAGFGTATITVTADDGNGGTATTAFAVTVLFIMGDSNFDGLVNVQDVILAINFALGIQTPTEDQFTVSDMNIDGTINIQDIILVVNTALGVVVAKSEESGTATITIQGDKVSIASETEIAGVQLDLVGVEDFVSGNISFSAPAGFNTRALFVNTDGTPIPAGLLLTADGFENVENVIIADRNGNEMETTIIELPTEFGLSQNYPNPFNPTTTISYQLPVSSEIRLQIYNLQGRLVETLVSEMQDAGFYSLEWNGSDVASGVYFYRLVADGFVSSHKMVLMK